MYVPQTIGPNPVLRRAAISWSGGKDCHLALWRAWQDESVQVVALVVFGPPHMATEFRAHPLKLMKAQAQAMSLPLLEYVIDVPAATRTDCHANHLGSSDDVDDSNDEGGNIDNPKGTPIGTAPSSYREQYVSCLRQLHHDHNIQVIYTGDMDYVGTMKYNWMTECCHDLLSDNDDDNDDDDNNNNNQVLKCELPLWKADRRSCLQELLDHKFEIVYTCVKSPWFENATASSSSSSWIGRTLDAAAIQEMQAIQQLQHDQKSLDLGGENGEFHTMCLNGPMYQQRLVLEQVRAETLQGFPDAQAAKDQTWWALHPDFGVMFVPKNNNKDDKEE
ncbi:hypothetical protein ACA910_021242 [Epithemia clementina (nom. ined.)]